MFDSGVDEASHWTGWTSKGDLFFFFNFISYDVFEPLDWTSWTSKGDFVFCDHFVVSCPALLFLATCFPKVIFLRIYHINKYFVLQVDITAKLFEGNNVDREFLVYRTIIQVKHKVTVTESDLLLCRQHL